MFSIEVYYMLWFNKKSGCSLEQGLACKRKCHLRLLWIFHDVGNNSALTSWVTTKTTNICSKWTNIIVVRFYMSNSWTVRSAGNLRLGKGLRKELKPLSLSLNQIWSAVTTLPRHPLPPPPLPASCTTGITASYQNLIPSLLRSLIMLCLVSRSSINPMTLSPLRVSPDRLPKWALFTQFYIAELHYLNSIHFCFSSF